MIHPPSTTVMASATGSALRTPLTTHHSTGSPSGSPRPRRWSLNLFLAGELQLGQIEVGQARRQLVETLRHVGQVRETGGNATCAQRIRRLGRSGTAALLLTGLLVLTLGCLA